MYESKDTCTYSKGNFLKILQSAKNVGKAILHVMRCKLELTFIDNLMLFTGKFYVHEGWLFIGGPVVAFTFVFKEQTELLACETLTSIFLPIQEHCPNSAHFVSVASTAIIYLKKMFILLCFITWCPKLSQVKEK